MTVFGYPILFGRWSTGMIIVVCVIVYSLMVNNKDIGLEKTGVASQKILSGIPHPPPSTQVHLNDINNESRLQPIKQLSSRSSKTTNINERYGGTQTSLLHDETNEPQDWFVGVELGALFKDSAINQHTLHISTIFQTKFSDSLENLNLHFRQVEKYLTTELMGDRAKIVDFLSFYRDFTEFTLEQNNDPQPLWLENPETIDATIRLNQAKQQYRRTVFGQDIADKVWGQELKNFEYKMSAMNIIRDDNYGAGMEIKNQLMAGLHAEYWAEGEQSASEQQNTQFYIKLASYGDALLNMTNEERLEKINEFRSEIFSPQENQRMADIEKEMKIEGSINDVEIEATSLNE